ncbi:MAG: FixH family protein [Chloroflexota bacterium]
MNKTTYYSTMLLAIFVLILAGCAPAAPQTASEAGLQMSVDVMPDPPAVGEGMLMVTLADSSGTPINDATLNVQGDMTHAGMVPVIRDVEGGAEEGVYSVPFEWTMGGDWIVTVLAVMSDGTEVEQTFDLSVASDGEMAMEHDDHGESAEGDGHDGHNAEEDGHDSHGEDGEGHHEDAEGHEGHGEDGDGHDKEMAMEMDAELVAAVGALDVKSLHDIDVSVNDGETIEAEFVGTVDQFMMSLSSITWSEMYNDDIEALNATLTSLKEALDAGDLEAAKPLTSEAHEMAHTLVEMVIEMGDGHDH